MSDANNPVRQVSATPASKFDVSGSNGIPKMQITSMRVVPVQVSGITSGNVTATRQLSATITLPLPKELEFASSFDWSLEDRSLLSNAIGNLNAPNSSRAVTDNPMTTIQSVLMRSVINGTSALGGESLARNAGYAVQPLKEIFFNGLSNRTFSWSWEFRPKNAQEANSINQLMRKIRIDAHPEKLAFGLYALPNEFEITWLNCKLPKIKTCICTSVPEDYAAIGEPRFFEDGNPAFTRMQLSFSEIEIHDRLSLESDTM